MLIKGNRPIKGHILINSSKNASLPISPTLLLCAKGIHKINEYPQFGDPLTMIKIMQSIGYQVTRNKANITIQTPDKYTFDALDHSLVSSIRASITLLPGLLIRNGYAEIKLPGGCDIGQRPVDMHCKILNQMGACVKIHDEYIIGKLPSKQFNGSRIVMDKISVGATQTAILASALAKGESTIVYAAQDPEVEFMASLINQMGGKIDGIGTHVLNIQGVDQLSPIDCIDAISDRIEAITIMLIGLSIPESDIIIENCPVKDIQYILDWLIKNNADIEIKNEKCIRVKHRPLEFDIDISTGHFPEIPTDAQPQIAIFASTVKGNHKIKEFIFESRFQYTNEFNKFDNYKDSFEVINNTLKINNSNGDVPYCNDVDLTCYDLRGGLASLMLALINKGTSKLNNIQHIERGHHQIFSRLNQCGANID